MALNVANWSDKQLDELTDLLRSADFSPVAAFITENFLCGVGSYIMDDDLQTPIRVSVGTPGTCASLSPGVFQHASKVGQVDTAQLINILDPTGPGAWGPGLAAYPGNFRWTIISIKWDQQYHTQSDRWFVDDTVNPNLYSKQQTLTLINKAYYDIIVTHGSAGGSIPSTPSGYFTIAEIYIPAGCTDLSTATIYDTTDVPPSYTSANWDENTRIQKLRFSSNKFDVDHNPATGYHRDGSVGTGWHIGGTEVKVSGGELNQALDGIGPTVTAPVLTALTNGSNVGTAFHYHGITNGTIYTVPGSPVLLYNSATLFGWSTWSLAGYGINAKWAVLLCYMYGRDDVDDTYGATFYMNFRAYNGATVLPGPTGYSLKDPGWNSACYSVGTWWVPLSPTWTFDLRWLCNVSTATDRLLQIWLLALIT